MKERDKKICPSMEELIVYIFFPGRLSAERQRFILAHARIRECSFCFFDKIRFEAEMDEEEARTFLERWEKQAPLTV